MHKFIFIFLCLLFISINTAYAADGTTLFWTTIKHTYALANPQYKINVLAQGRFRTTRDPSMDQIYFRGGVAYLATKTLRLFLGYDIHIIKNPTTGEIFYEHRPWQQLLWQATQWRYAQLVLRTRLEQRIDTIHSGAIMRLRQNIIVTFHKIINDKVTPIISNEVFLNIIRPRWIRDNSFNQNRFFIGARFAATKNNKINLGYLNQFISRSPRNSVNHIIYVEFLV